MKLPLEWLNEFVKVNISAEELSDKLTMTGQEVESIETDVMFDGVVVGEVIERIKHPNADKLNVAKVRIADSHPEGAKRVEGSVLQIVCGAQNLNVGQKVPVALEGAKLGELEIKKVEIRGVKSSGMICSEKELGISEKHEGIMVLDRKAQVGTAFTEYIGTEKLLDIKVQANRPDCMGIIGLAREVAVTLNKSFVSPPFVIPAEAGIQASGKVKIPGRTPGMTADFVDIEIKDKELCPRYVARVVKNVKISESPNWLKKRLMAMGVRPINNLVDISNYVMLETGQPLHFFDLNKLNQGKKAKIVVRRAKKGEEIVTLDGMKRKLTEDMLVIADRDKPIALAGVMGGENTEVDEKTTDILIEAAVFEKSCIRRTSRALGLRSEAVARFEKGIPFQLPASSIDRAAELLAELADGEIASEKVDVKSKDEKETNVELDLDKLNKFLGVNVPEKDVIKIFNNLGFDSNFEINNSKLKLTVPWWRSDIKMTADLYEEVARFWGYDRIPATLPKTVNNKITENISYEAVKRARELLSNIGLTEVITYSFNSKKELEAVGEKPGNAPKIANPLVSEQEFMRTSLVPNMLMALKDNQFHKENILLFEIGKTFRIVKGQKLPRENKSLAIGVIGGKSWPIKYPKGENYYQLKGIISRLLAEYNLSLSDFSPQDSQLFIEGQSAKVTIGGQEIGSLGIVNKNILNKFDLKKEAAVAVIDFDFLENNYKNIYCFQDFSKFPKIVRDISVIFGKEVNIGQVVDSLKGTDKLISNIEIIDIYEGKPLEKGKRSITVRLDFSSFDKTLTDKEVDAIMNVCIGKLRKMGGEIRVGNS